MNDQRDDDAGGPSSDGSPLWPLLIIAFVFFAVGIFLRQPDEDVTDNINEVAALAIYIAAFAVIATLVLPPRELPPPREEVPARPLCSHCIKPYVEGAHFCPRCGCPQTFFAGTADYESIYAAAWCIGKAARHPSRFIHIVGLVLIFIPPVFMVVGLNAIPYERYWGWDFVGLGASIALIYIYGLVLLTGLRNWRVRKQAPELLEPESAYGHPPYWTFDRWWLLPEEEDPEDDRVE